MNHYRLYELLQLLSPAQRKEVLGNFELRQGKSGRFTGSLSQKLLAFLIEAENPPGRAVLNKVLYGKDSPPSEESHQRLVSRAFQKAGSLALMLFNEEQSKTEQENKYARIELSNKISLFNHIQLRGGCNELLTQLQDEIIRMATEYEIYPVLLEHLALKKTTHEFHHGPKATEKLEKSLSLCQRNYKSLLRATGFYHRISRKTNRGNAGPAIDIEEEIEKEVRFLEIEAEATGSKNILYYLLSLKYTLFELRKDMNAQRDLCHEIIDLMKSSKVVFSIERMGMALGYLANMDMVLGEFWIALRRLEDRRIYFKNNSKNYFINYSLEFRCNYYLGQYEKARDCLALLKQSGLKFFDETEKSEFEIFNAFLLIREKQYKKAISNLKKKNKASEDSMGMDFWRRVSLILLYVITGAEDQAAKIMANLEKHLARKNLVMALPPRESMVLKILKVLHHDGFRADAPGFIKDEIQHLVLNPELKWKPIGEELIPFEEFLNMAMESHKTKRP